MWSASRGPPPGSPNWARNWVTASLLWRRRRGTGVPRAASSTNTGPPRWCCAPAPLRRCRLCRTRRGKRSVENWSVDVAQAFHWTRAALTRPLAPGSSVIALSSGAALKGSPLSGGYAGAKATVRFITSYAAAESERNGLGIEFVSVLPQLTPDTDLGLAAVQAYAGRQGVDVDAFVQSMAPVLTSEHVGKTVLEIATGRLRGHHAYALASAGASALD